MGGMSHAMRLSFAYHVVGKALEALIDLGCLKLSSQFYPTASLVYKLYRALETHESNTFNRAL